MQREIEPAITGKTTSMRTDYLYCSVNVKTVRDAFTVNVHLVCVCVCVLGGGGGGVGEESKPGNSCWGCAAEILKS